MHELSLALEIVDAACARAGKDRILRVILEVGALSCAAPEALQFNFEACCKGTAAEGAVLEIRRVPGRGRCRTCGSALALDSPWTPCPCGSLDVEWTAGDGVRIKALEVTDDV